MAAITIVKQGPGIAIAARMLDRNANRTAVCITPIVPLLVPRVQRRSVAVSLGTGGTWTATATESHVSEITRDREIWGIALWVEKQHGENGWLHIAQQQDRLLNEGNFEGMKLWRKVGERFEELIAQRADAPSH